jgi:hypothetical protein
MTENLFFFTTQFTETLKLNEMVLSIVGSHVENYPQNQSSIE